MRKPAFSFAKTKTQISCAVTAQLISAFVFATWIVQSLFYLNPKFQACSHLLWLYSLVCVRPGRKPLRPIFSQRGTFTYIKLDINTTKEVVHTVTAALRSPGRLCNLLEEPPQSLQTLNLVEFLRCLDNGDLVVMVPDVKVKVIRVYIFKVTGEKLLDTKLAKLAISYEPRYEKTSCLHMRKQRCRSAAQCSPLFSLHG